MLKNIVGQVINGYLFEGALGSGSFGAVYRVSKENNVYAAKVLSETYGYIEKKMLQNNLKKLIK